MNDNFIFIWLCWILWTLSTFFMPKSKLRTAFSCWLLIIIISSPTSIVLNDYLSISIAFISLLIGAMLMYSLKEYWFYHLIVIFSLTFAHMALLFLMKVSPILIILSPTIMIALLNASLTIISQKKLFQQLFIVVLGMGFGDLMYGFILNNYYMAYRVGHFPFLSQLFMTILCLMLWQAMVQLRNWSMDDSDLLEHQMSLPRERTSQAE